MKKLLVLLCTAVALNAQTTITVTLTAEQEAAITAALVTINAERAAQETPQAPLTVKSYAELLIQSKLANIVKQQAMKVKQTFDAAYAAADQKLREDAKAVLTREKAVEAVVTPK